MTIAIRMTVLSAPGLNGQGRTNYSVLQPKSVLTLTWYGFQAARSGWDQTGTIQKKRPFIA
jgi:hypothetical protein